MSKLNNIANEDVVHWLRDTEYTLKKPFPKSPRVLNRDPLSETDDLAPLPDNIAKGESDNAKSMLFLVASFQWPGR